MLLPVTSVPGAQTPIHSSSTARSIGFTLPFTLDFGAQSVCIPSYLDNGVERYGQPLFADIAAGEFRGSIVGLEPGKHYVFSLGLIRWDGFNRTTITGRRTSLEDSSEREGRTIHVSPDGDDAADGSFERPLRALAAAGERARRGDEVLIRAGTYRETLSFQRNDDRFGVITFRGEEGAVIDGEHQRDHNVLLRDARDVRITGLRLINARRSAVRLVDCSFAGIVGNRIQNWGTAYFDAGVEIGPGCTATRVLDNQIEMSRGEYTSGRLGIVVRQGADGRHAIARNTIAGNALIKDGIGGEGNFDIDGGVGPDTDIYENIISGCRDDGIEAEGGNINVRIWGNRITDCPVGIALAPTIKGPCYVWRNVITNVTQAAFKLGEGERSGHGPLFLYHNTIWTLNTNAACYAGYGGKGLFERVTARNNLIGVGGYALEDSRGGRGNSFDHDLLWTTDPDRFANWSNERLTYEEIRDRTGFWSDAIRAKPLFREDGRFAPAADSPAIDAGVLLPGFNDGFTGLAPDVGAEESG